jgi:hypothetical protein
MSGHPASRETEQLLALAWLSLGRFRSTPASAGSARVLILKAVDLPDPRRYLRRTPKPGNAAEIGSSSGTRLASFSASSYST